MRRRRGRDALGSWKTHQRRRSKSVEAIWPGFPIFFFATVVTDTYRLPEQPFFLIEPEHPLVSVAFIAVRAHSAKLVKMNPAV